MSIERTPQGSYRVRWREGSKNRSRIIGSRKDAAAFDAEIKRSKRMGTFAHLDMGNSTLTDFVANEWWPKERGKLAPKTQAHYAYLFDIHIEPDLGNLKLREITIKRADEWLADMESRGVGRRAQQHARSLLVGILNKAVRWEKLATNPVTFTERPRVTKQPIQPPTPLEVERVRQRLEESGRIGDAVLVSVLAYAGLRPQEALALTWGDIGDRAILVRSPKTARYEGKSYRSVTMWGPLRKDLAEWRLMCGVGVGADRKVDTRTTRGPRKQPGVSADSSLVFPSKNGKQITETGWHNWRRRCWYGDDPKYKNAGVFGPGARRFRPYDCRHLFVSLSLAAGQPITEVAAQAGHSVTECLRTYAHLIPEMSGQQDPEAVIRAARAEVGERRRAV